MAQLPPFQEMESLNLLPGGWEGGLKRKRPGKASKQAKKARFRGLGWFSLLYCSLTKETLVSR